MSIGTSDSVAGTFLMVKGQANLPVAPPKGSGVMVQNPRCGRQWVMVSRDDAGWLRWHWFKWRWERAKARNRKGS